MLEDSFSFDSPEGFNRQAIDRPILQTPHADGSPRVEGDDAGYRDVPVDDDGEPLVALTEEHGILRPIYDGVDPLDGSQNPADSLPGGVEGKMYVRESVAIALKAFTDYLRERYGDRVKPILVDAFRSFQRQAAGHSGLIVRALGDNKKPSAEQFFNAGQKADATFSYVRLNHSSPEVVTFLGDVRGSADLSKDLQVLAGKMRVPFDELLMEWATFCVNLNVRQQLGFDRDVANPYNSDRGGDLNFEGNAHAGGGAVDGFLGLDGRIVSSLAKYDHMGPWAAKEILENPANFERYRLAASTNPELSSILQSLGIKPETMTFEQWQFAMEANRVYHHATKRMGATYYSAANPEEGGENWHVEFGNVVRDPRNGNIIHQAPSASRYWNSGNPGHALQRMPQGKAIAVWGGTAAHRQLGLI